MGEWRMKKGDYVKAQQPGNWPWEGKVVGVIEKGPLEYSVVVIELNPDLYPTIEEKQTIVTTSEQFVKEVNGEKYNVMDKTYDISELLKLLK